MEKESRLREVLRSRNQTLHTLAVHLVSQATPNLWHSLSTFPSGTSHTPLHTEAVEQIAGMLIPDPILAALTDDELFFLILACHYHDLGMVGTEADNETVETRERVRRDHAVSVGVKIVANWQQLGFPDQATAEVLAEICRGHRPKKDASGTATWGEMSQYRTLGPGRAVRLRLLSAMIYAADELHLGSDRASKREEEFKQISDIEARRHWRRHQAITGPALVDGVLSFDVYINTLCFEADLRKTAQKALFAVRDFRRELASAGIKGDLPTIGLQWLRRDLWWLLLVETTSDLVPRTPDAIAETIADRFETARKDFIDLSALCSENPGPTELFAQVRQSIDDLIVQDYISRVPNTMTYAPSVTSRYRDRFLETARIADGTEALFGQPNPPQHEHSLYLSPLGKSIIRDLGFPEVKSQYAVDLAAEPTDSAIRRTFESSPTAYRITSTINTPPGVLVKRDLLNVAVLAGVCFDLMDNPALILDSDFRAAVKTLFATVMERLPRYQRFIEELALVGGLSYEQIGAMIAVSEEMRKELEPQQHGDGPTVTISQTVPKDRTDWGIAWLLLAGQRSGEPVTLLNVENSQLAVKVTPTDDQFARLGEQAPLMIQFGPGEAQRLKEICLRATVDFSASDKLLRFNSRPLYQDTSGYPFILQIPLKPPEGEGSISLAIYLPELTVGTLRKLTLARETIAKRAVDMQVEVDGIGVMARHPNAANNALHIPDLIEDDVLTILADFDRDLPFPCAALADMFDAIVKSPAEDRRRNFQEATERRKAVRPHLTSIRLRLADAFARDYHEEFLGFLPQRGHFRPPTVSGSGTMTQEQLDALWNAGDQHFRFDMHFREDHAKLTSELRTWMDDPTQSFPFKGAELSPRDFHFCKTTIEREHLPFIDRVWYIERPVVFRFRPASKSEQYRIEKAYWDEVGDRGRSELVQERIADAEREEKDARDKQAPIDAAANEPPRE
jgi:hypothetical protein